MKIKSKPAVRFPLSIGEAAQMLGISTSQLRLYEMQGVISPLRHGFRGRGMRWYCAIHLVSA